MKRKSAVRIKALWIALIGLVALWSALIIISNQHEYLEVSERFSEPVSDRPYQWTYSKADLQLPELPTGCEATAAATLAKMNGAYLSKIKVANALPKSNSDYVHSFLGSPYMESGWACAAPAIVQTLNSLLPEHLEAVERAHFDLHELPLPSMVWTTIDLVSPGDSKRQVGDYGLYRHSHCMVLLDVQKRSVGVVDPLRGLTRYPLDQFEAIYNHVGQHAIYIQEVS